MAVLFVELCSVNLFGNILVFMFCPQGKVQSVKGCASTKCIGFGANMIPDIA